MPILGVIGNTRLTSFWPATSAFPDLPGAVAGAMVDDESGWVGNEGVGARDIAFLPVGENPL